MSQDGQTIKWYIKNISKDGLVQWLSEDWSGQQRNLKGKPNTHCKKLHISDSRKQVGCTACYSLIGKHACPDCIAKSRKISHSLIKQKLKNMLRGKRHS